MLATLADAPTLVRKGLVYEPEVRRHPRAGRDDPEGALRASGRATATRRPASFPPSPGRSTRPRPGSKGPLVLDGEIVALDERGRPAGFQRLQGRMHLSGAQDIERAEQAQPAALIVFDILRDGKDRSDRVCR